MYKKTIIFFFPLFFPLFSFAQFNTISMSNTQYKMYINDERDEVTEDIEDIMGDGIEGTIPDNGFSPDYKILPTDIITETINCSLPLKDIIINSNYGIRKDPFSGKRKAHYGLDLKADNSPVFSMLPGKVKKVGYDKRAGIYITIENSVCSFSYCHLSKINVLQDNYVRAGQLVGTSGNTGNSTGPHLHITCRWKDNNKTFNPLTLINLIRREGNK